MQVVEDFSYGVIPFLRKEEGVFVFLINQYGQAGDVFWTFPKGHKEEGETPVEAATRELKEETGLTLKELYETYAYVQEYTFESDGAAIRKAVAYYLGEAADETYKIQEAEVAEASWFPLDEARAKLSFESAQAIFDEARKDIELRINEDKNTL